MCVLICSFSDEAPMKSASSGKHVEVFLGLAVEIWFMYRFFITSLYQNKEIVNIIAQASFT